MELLKNFAEKHNIDFTEDICKKFEVFSELLIEKNKVMNLTSIEDPKEIEIKHMIDSLQSADLIRSFGDHDFSLIDIGTGGGFPGVPLKIVFPENRFVLLDSLNKRISFINEVVASLNLKNVESFAARAEDYAKAERESFDFCVSRAVARLNVLVEYCLPFVKVGGFCILYKSADCDEEITEAQNAIKELGGEFIKKEVFELPDNSGSRSLIVIRKTDICPEKYPRKAGKPSKSPIK